MTNVPYGSSFASLGLLVRDFAAFAGGKGLKALVFVLLGALVEGVSILLLIPFFSVIIDAQNGVGWMQSTASWLFGLFSAESRLAKLILLLVFFAILMVARAVILTVRDVTMAQLEIDFIHHIRSRITRRLAAAQWDTLARLRHARITHLMGTDIQEANSAIYMLLRDSVALAMLASQVLLAFLLAPLLAALALIVVLLGAATLPPLIKRARRIGSFVTDANLSLIDDMTQFLGALKLAISQNLQKSFTREFEATLANLREQQVRYIRQQTVTRLAVTTLSGLVIAVAIVLGVAVFDTSAEILITLLLIFSRMSGPTMQLQLDAQHIAHALPAYEKILELESDLIAEEAKTTDSSGPALDLPGGPIVAHGVWFLHQAAESGTAGGVRGIDLTIEPGSIIGIAGPSGAGKTTFADLLVGLYPPQRGEITVGGVALRGPTIAAWRNLVSYVAQDPFLFHDTVRRNLLWANPEVDEAALWDALRIAGAEDIVGNLPQGIDTIVGERGSLLSGGERQRLCLARAMLRRPRLLVLDEATSAIDIEGERFLLERLLLAVPRPTIVMVAHRPESLRYCQRILVLESGKLVSDNRRPSTQDFRERGARGEALTS